MEFLHAIFLGIVEGLTEFLPISSTGHLIVAQHLIGFKDTAELFTVVIQIGSIAAVVWHYRIDILKRRTGLLKRDKTALRFWTNMIIGTIPAGLAALVLDKIVQSWATPSVVAIALIIGGIILWLVEEYHQKEKPRPRQVGYIPEARLDDITLSQALGVGVAQIVALVPGASRSGSTIVGGLLVGLDRVTATAFSFYLSIPIMILATGYKILKQRHDVSALPGGLPALIAGIIAAFITGLFAVSWLLRYISSHDFKPFAYYRIAFGVFILFLLATRLIR